MAQAINSTMVGTKANLSLIKAQTKPICQKNKGQKPDSFGPYFHMLWHQPMIFNPLIVLYRHFALTKHDDLRLSF